MSTRESLEAGLDVERSNVSEEHMEFNYAVLPALKGLYDAVDSLAT